MFSLSSSYHIEKIIFLSQTLKKFCKNEQGFFLEQLSLGLLIIKLDNSKQVLMVNQGMLPSDV